MECLHHHCIASEIFSLEHQIWPAGCGFVADDVGEAHLKVTWAMQDYTAAFQLCGCMMRGKNLQRNTSSPLTFATFFCNSTRNFFQTHLQNHDFSLCVCVYLSVFRNWIIWPRPQHWFFSHVSIAYTISSMTDLFLQIYVGNPLLKSNIGPRFQTSTAVFRPYVITYNEVGTMRFLADWNVPYRVCNLEVGGGCTCSWSALATAVNNSLSVLNNINKNLVLMSAPGSSSVTRPHWSFKSISLYPFWEWNVNNQNQNSRDQQYRTRGTTFHVCLPRCVLT